jgi:hypothetical protein
MSTSDLKRFIAYLQSDALTQVVVRAGIPADAASGARCRALDLDFDELGRLLERHAGDAVVQEVLMDGSGDERLACALSDVKARLREVEGQSIAAYIDEAAPLTELHDEVPPSPSAPLRLPSCPAPATRASVQLCSSQTPRR